MARRGAFRLAVAGAVVLGLARTMLGADQPPGCASVASEPMEIAATLEVGPVWTGTFVDFAATRRGDDVFLGYYDAGRRLTIAHVDLRARRIEKKALDEVFGGWDSHRYITLALDGAARLHVAGNMQTAPLVYYAAAEPLDIFGLERRPMIGSDENSVTYPTFVRRDAELLFAHRNGPPGKGGWHLNRWNGTRWERLIEGQWLGNRNGDRPTTGYLSNVAEGPDGVFHIAIVWRGTYDLSGNYRITYAQTRDFRAWSRADGAPILGALGPDNTDLVAQIGEKGGLTNGHKVGVDDRGRPVVLYSRYAQGRRATIVAAHRVEGSGWIEEAIETSEEPEPLEGPGSAPNIPWPLAVRAAGREVALDYVLASHARRACVDARSLRPARPPEPLRRISVSNLPAPDRIGSGTPERPNYAPIGPDGQSPALLMTWTTQDVNRDRPRGCTAAQPTACDPPPSMLRLHVLKKAKDAN